jgi:hypothetical protein
MEQYINLQGTVTGRFTSEAENEVAVPQMSFVGVVEVSDFMPTFSIYDIMGIKPETEVAHREKELAFWERKYRATNKASQKKRIKRKVNFKQHMLAKAKEDMENYYTSKEKANEDRNSK